MFRILPYLICLLCAVSCVPRSEPEPEKTQLEIREFQTRTFEVNDYSGVMKSILNVLQDDGYMVKNVHSELGFLSATKEVSLNDTYWGDTSQEPDLGFGFSIGSGGSGFGIRSRFPNDRRSRPHAIHESIEATITVSQYGEKVRVRASFQSKIIDSVDGLLRVKNITDEIFYQDFFFKVDKGIFLHAQEI